MSTGKATPWGRRSGTGGVPGSAVGFACFSGSTRGHASSSLPGSMMSTRSGLRAARTTLTPSSRKCSRRATRPMTGRPCWQPARPTGRRKNASPGSKRLSACEKTPHKLSVLFQPFSNCRNSALVRVRRRMGAMKYPHQPEQEHLDARAFAFLKLCTKPP